MGQTSDQLRHQIEDKREDAAAKIDAIETRVQNTAQMARDTVDETMQAAKETVSATVSETMDTVTETVQTVKQEFDFNKQVQERPLVMLGAAALGGFLLGGMVGGGEKRHRSEHHYQYQGGSSGSGPMQQAIKSTGLDTTMSAVTGALVGMAADRLRGIVDESFPEFGERLRQEMGSSSNAPRTQHRYDTAGHAAVATSGGELPRPEGAQREPLR